MSNLYRCQKCKMVLTSEELEAHKHGQIQDLKIIGDKILIIEDDRFYTLNINTRFGTPKQNTDKEDKTTISALIRER